MNDLLLDDAKHPLKYAVEKIPNKYQDYLASSKMRNPKLNPDLNNQLKNKNSKVVQLEEGFSLYFNGANSELSLSKKDNKLTAIAPRKYSKTCEERSKSGLERPTWANATKLGFLTERGNRIFVKPNSYYSEDFEEVEKEIDKVEDNCGRISVEMSLNDLRSLRHSLEESNHDPLEKKWVHDLGRIPEDEEKIVTLELISDSETGIWDRMSDSENQLKEIVERVLKLDLIQQKKLLKTIENIENCKQETGTTVSLFIEENWGHPTLVGMTEVEFWDSEKQVIAVKRVSIENLNYYDSELSQLTNLVNGKKDTAKDRYMWSCHWSANETLKIDFHLCTNSVKDVQFLAIYNHNRSLDSLSMGVKKVFLLDSNAQVLCSGIVQKALGNLAFNPPTMLKTDVLQRDNVSVNSNDFNSDEDDDDLCLMDKFHHATRLINTTQSQETSENSFKLDNPKEIKISPLNSEKAAGNDIKTYRKNQEKIENPRRLEVNSKLIEEINLGKEEETSQNLYEISEIQMSEGGLIGLRKDNYYLDELVSTISNNAENTERKQTSARFGRRADHDSENPINNKNDYHCNPLKDIVAQFTQDIQNEKTTTSFLEKSWSSLKFFSHSQAGRLSLAQETNDDFVTSVISSNSRLPTDRCEFVIPELPRGRELRLNILTTWGDPHYVGLTGIEMFSAAGIPVLVDSICADPSDINILPGYGSDPRVVQNLLDGVNRTRDDVHMWLAPFTAHRDHVITILFCEPVELALLRIWNYNKSRIHSSRGARDVEIILDDILIFRGEIARLIEGEVILFTGDDAILNKIGSNDHEFFDGLDSDDENGNQTGHCSYSARANELLASLALRPPTAKEMCSNETNSSQKINIHNRPFTSTRNTQEVSGNQEKTIVVRIIFLESWGDQFYMGLNGIEFVDNNGNLVSVSPGNVFTNMESLPENDVRNISNLFDGVNVTTSDEHIWLAPFTEENTIIVTIKSTTRICAMRIWNYNKSLEDSYRGVKTANIWINDKRISPEEGYFLRRAPGHIQYNFVQEINLKKDSAIFDDLSQYQNLPCGFVYQINIFSAWSDPYYVGMNGIEFFDHVAKRISIHPHQVYAYPDSVNSLTPKNQLTISHLDVRTPDKLVDGVNNTYDPKHMWLAPILPGCLNKIFIVFDRPISLSMIHLWNYSKTPSRGVKDFSVLVDDLLIHSGTLPCATSSSISRGILPNMNDTVPPSNPHKAILFDKNNVILMESERLHLLEYNVSNGQDVVLINDNDTGSTKFANQEFRPMTSVKNKPKVK